MIEDRRSFLRDTGRLLLLTGAASLAWEHVLAGAPEAAPNYTLTDHWWGMIIDIDKCIGCGNCVRACKAENGVPLDRRHLPHVGRALQRELPTISITRTVDSPNGGYDGFPDCNPPATKRQGLLRARRCATTARIRRASRSARSARPSRARTAWCWSTRRTASAAATACRPARTAAASSIRGR